MRVGGRNRSVVLKSSYTCVTSCNLQTKIRRDTLIKLNKILYTLKQMITFVPHKVVNNKNDSQYHIINKKQEVIE